MYRARSTHTGDSFFDVDLVEISTGRSESITFKYGNADEIDTFTIYDDDRTFRNQEGNYLLTVDADGSWQVHIELISAH